MKRTRTIATQARRPARALAARRHLLLAAAVFAASLVLLSSPYCCQALLAYPSPSSSAADGSPQQPPGYLSSVQDAARFGSATSAASGPNTAREFYVHPGDSVTLECKISCAACRKQWNFIKRQDADLLYQRDEYMSDGTAAARGYQLSMSDDGSYDLRINNASFDTHDGLYQCRSADAKVSVQYRVVVLLPPQPPSVQPAVGTLAAATEKLPFALVCTVSGGNPEPTITWFRNDKILSAANALAAPPAPPQLQDLQTQQLPNMKIDVERDANLFTSNSTLTWTPTADDHEATFKCAVSNAATAMPSASLKLDSELQVSVQHKPGEAELVVGNNGFTELGRQTLLACRASPRGFPEPMYSFKRGEQPVHQGTHINYTIISAKATDEGDYSCEAANDFGKSSLATAHLTVNETPSIVKSLIESDHRPLGTTSYSLSVQVNGKPQPRVQWFHRSPIDGRRVELMSNSPRALFAAPATANASSPFAAAAAAAAAAAGGDNGQLQQQIFQIETVAHRVDSVDGKFSVHSTLKFLKPLGVDDRGLYSVEMSNGLSQIAQSEAQLHIDHTPLPVVSVGAASQGPQSISQQQSALRVLSASALPSQRPLERVAFDLGEQAMIPCRVSAYPRPQFTWHMPLANGNLLPIEPEKTPRYAIKEQNLVDDIWESTLVFAQVVDSDYGEYICTSANVQPAKELSGAASSAAAAQLLAAAASPALQHAQLSESLTTTISLVNKSHVEPPPPLEAAEGSQQNSLPLAAACVFVILVATTLATTVHACCLSKRDKKAEGIERDASQANGNANGAAGALMSAAGEQQKLGSGLSGNIQNASAQSAAANGAINAGMQSMDSIAGGQGNASDHSSDHSRQAKLDSMLPPNYYGSHYADVTQYFYDQQAQQQQQQQQQQQPHAQHPCMPSPINNNLPFTYGTTTTPAGSLLDPASHSFANVGLASLNASAADQANQLYGHLSMTDNSWPGAQMPPPPPPQLQLPPMHQQQQQQQSAYMQLPVANVSLAAGDAGQLAASAAAAGAASLQPQESDYGTIGRSGRVIREIIV